tara:strand:+ start:263 stop:388 length:126 start_codon:yes stop_codon:yes gene_type:complete
MSLREDKLKNLLSGSPSNEDNGPQEINIGASISPVAKIKVV